VSKPQHAEIAAFLAEHQHDLRHTGVHFVMRTRRGWKAVDAAQLIEMFRQRSTPPPERKAPPGQGLPSGIFKDDDEEANPPDERPDEGGHRHARST
jgi:hypothetical protein